MNIIKRICAICCAFNPAHTDDEPSCWNLVSVIEPPRHYISDWNGEIPSRATGKQLTRGMNQG